MAAAAPDIEADWLIALLQVLAAATLVALASSAVPSDRPRRHR